jgi:hypothetical protein
MSTSAKDLRVAPIDAWAAKAFVRRVHYSGSTTQNSQLHLGVFLGDRLAGAMQFGPSLDKSKIVGLVRATPWNGFLELNRLAFTDELPRNSESRAIGVAMRMIRKNYPHIQWVISFADATQCGDGTIYRASGFVLTGINKNKTIWEFAGDTFSHLSLTTGGGGRGGAEKRRALEIGLREQQKPLRLTDLSLRLGGQAMINKVSKGAAIRETGASSMKPFKELGFKPAIGFQLRYIYFLDPTAKDRLTVPILPFSAIADRGAGMYRGQARAKQAMAEHHSAQRRGSSDPHAPIERVG